MTRYEGKKNTSILIKRKAMQLGRWSSANNVKSSKSPRHPWQAVHLLAWNAQLLYSESSSSSLTGPYSPAFDVSRASRQHRHVVVLCPAFVYTNKQMRGNKRGGLEEQLYLGGCSPQCRLTGGTGLTNKTDCKIFSLKLKAANHVKPMA